MRNVTCKNYDDCLKAATILNRGFSCEWCRYRHQENPVDSDGYVEKVLLLAIFRPEIYRQYRELEKWQMTQK